MFLTSGIWRAFLTAGLCFGITCGLRAESDVHAAIDKSLPYLEQAGVTWMEKRGCVSCHQVPFMLWSLSAASENGFKVDRDKLQQWQDWSTQVRNFVKPNQKDDLDQKETLAANIDTMNALLLAIQGDSQPDWRATFSEALIDNQQDDGSWKACGQLPAQKRPGRETTRVTVLWTLLALAKEGQEPKDLKSAFELADQSQDAVSTEWWVARLLLADQWGASDRENYRNELLSRQREDGGWGWLSDDPSDALATGMALYAVELTAQSQQSDEAAEIDEASGRAVRFLLSTQNENGSWNVPGTKKSTRDQPTPTSNYWGTAWAVIGMLETID